MDHVHLTTEVLDVGRAQDLVKCSTAGAISIFIGTTRDNFEGKEVVRLEYEAYEPMAIQEIKKICQDIRNKWDIKNICMMHRLGFVPVTEASVVIAISSAHRKESLQAVEYAIDSLKATVPIWKKEMYADGEGTWKENKECIWSSGHKNGAIQETTEYSENTGSPS